MYDATPFTPRSTHTHSSSGLLAMAFQESSGIIDEETWAVFECEGTTLEHILASHERRALVAKHQICTLEKYLLNQQRDTVRVIQFCDDQEQRYTRILKIEQHKNITYEKATKELKNQVCAANTKSVVLNLTIQRKNDDIASLRQVYTAGMDNARQELTNIMEYVAYMEQELRAAQSYTSPPPIYKL